MDGRRDREEVVLRRRAPRPRAGSAPTIRRCPDRGTARDRPAPGGCRTRPRRRGARASRGRPPPRARPPSSRAGCRGRRSSGTGSRSAVAERRRERAGRGCPPPRPGRPAARTRRPTPRRRRCARRVGQRRRPRISSVSVSSWKSSTSIAPYRRSTAENARPEPTSAPVCESAARAAASERPTLRQTTGLPASAQRRETCGERARGGAPSRGRVRSRACRRPRRGSRGSRRRR